MNFDIVNLSTACHFLVLTSISGCVCALSLCWSVPVFCDCVSGTDGIFNSTLGECVVSKVSFFVKSIGMVLIDVLEFVASLMPTSGVLDGSSNGLATI